MTQAAVVENADPSPEFIKAQEALSLKFEEEIVATFNKHLEGGLAPLSIAASAIGQSLMLMVAVATSQNPDRESAVEEAVSVFDKTVEFVRKSITSNIGNIVDAMYAEEVKHEQP